MKGAILIAMVIVPAIALGAGIAVSMMPVNEIDPRESPVFVSVKEGDFTDATDVQLALVWADGPTLKAPAWSGVVTATADLGTPLTNGVPVIQIDGVWRIAAKTAAPFYRPIGPGVSGGDVAALNDLLASLGYPSKVGAAWTSTTLAGVKRLALSIGLDPKVTGAFDPAWVVWLPEDVFTVSAYPFAVGQGAPAAGEPVAESRAALESATMTTEGTPLPAASDKDQWTVRLGGADLGFSGSPAIATQALAALSVAVPERSETATATLERLRPKSAWGVPASSVFTDSRSQLCVFVEVKDARPPWRPIGVEVSGGDIGQTRVTGLPDSTLNVLVNPAAAVGAETCESN